MNTATAINALKRFEATYANDRQQEHALLVDAAGNIVALKDGTVNHVDFTPDELAKAQGGLISHSHPKGRPLSKDDLTCAAENGLTIRAFGTAPSGIAHTYVASFTKPDRSLADELSRVYGPANHRAERDLSAQAHDEQWSAERTLQNARHLTNERLAERYGFVYQRWTRRALSEATRHERARLDTFSVTELALADAVFGPLSASLVALLNRHATSTGKVDASRLPHVRRAAAGQVTRAILGSPDTPLRSPYARTLLHAMHTAAQLAVDEQAAIMRRYLPDDLVRAYAFATINPFERDVAEERYDPLHEWLGDDNRTLSDRIWNLTGSMRQKLDAYLTDAISAGKPVSQMAHDLEMYLMPGRKGLRSARYGDDFSADALRLARTEVSAAYHRAGALAALENPFVTGYSFFTAPQHECCDVCDDVEAGGPYDKSDMAHLPPQHPNCICSVRWIIVKNPQAVVKLLREQVQDAVSRSVKSVTDVIGPLSRKFVDLLFGSKA